MLIVLFCLDGVTEVARPRPYRGGLRSHLVKFDGDATTVGTSSHFYQIHSRSHQYHLKSIFRRLL